MSLVRVTGLYAALTERLQRTTGLASRAVAQTSWGKGQQWAATNGGPGRTGGQSRRTVASPLRARNRHLSTLLSLRPSSIQGVQQLSYPASQP